MSFLARLATDLITVEAGATTPTSIEIINRGDASDQFELTIEGLDPEWTAVPVPLVTVAARESQEEKLFFKPPRVSESSAGNYPFVLKVRSLTSGEARTVQGVLTVKPYNHLSVEISPKKGFVSPLKRNNTFDATLINLGNTEHTVQLFGSDPEEACAFEFDQEQVSIGPGQQKTVLVTVNPTKQGTFSGSRLYGFSISARSIEQPSVVAVAQAQLEQRPIMSLGSMAVAIIVAFIIGLWIYLIPAKPTLKVSVSRSEITKGDTLTVSWQATGQPTSVHLVALGQTIYDGADNKGSRDFTPTFPAVGTVNSFQITGYAEKDGRQYSLDNAVVISVKEPPHIDDPHIDAFKLDQTSLSLGQTVTVTYKVTGATKVTLLPMGTTLDPSVDQTQITVNDINTTMYTLVAANSVGVTVRKSIHVTVSVQSKAAVISFTALPTRIDAIEGDVMLSWQVTNAVRTELSAGAEVQTVDATGSQRVHISKNTTFTVTAFDDAGVPVRRTLKVVVVPPPVIPDNNLPPPGGPPPVVTTTTTGQ